MPRQPKRELRREPPTHMEVRGARVHNLKNVDISIPLNKMVGIAGVSGSGKSSLALGVLYSEGSRRYLDALSTYTRRRISQSARASVDSVEHVPAALALRQRPGVGGVRSTFGTSTELLNVLRLLFSRVGSHICPNGHHVPPTMMVALEQEITCPECGARFMAPGAEEMAFNSDGACPHCTGIGEVREVNEAALVPDESKSINEGAVLPWGSLMWDLMKDVCGAMGVRLDVPFCELTPEERDIVFHGPAVKKHILHQSKKGDSFAELDFTYYNAVYTVENALSKAKDEKALARLDKFLITRPCPECGGTRLNLRARSATIDGKTLPEVCALTLDELMDWVSEVPEKVAQVADDPEAVGALAKTIIDELDEPAKRLQQLGLGYLSLDRATSTLSTGERQRVQLSRAVRNRTTGVLYVMDEPSIGLHPSNVDGLLSVFDGLLDDGNSVVVVDHDVRVLRESDWLIEIGPGSGDEGGKIIAQGTVEDVCNSPKTRVGGFIDRSRSVFSRERTTEEQIFDRGCIHLETNSIHTVKPLQVDFPVGRLTAVTGVSGSGKTTLVLESLIPGMNAIFADQKLPEHVTSLDPCGITRCDLIDASPIGINVRSTVATYSGVLDDLRKAYASTPAAKAGGYKVGAFSYNTGNLRCPTCDGTGQISLDVQFLPDVDIVCPDCNGRRYAQEAYTIELGEGEYAITLPDLLSLTVRQALAHVEHFEQSAPIKRVVRKLATLNDLGLGYLTLGEATPALSGGEAQRLKLSLEMGKKQNNSLFVFDEPTIGLHPLDVEVLLKVLQQLVDAGATVVVIEHDLDMIANSDYVIDMGPGGGEAGGRVVATGTPAQVAQNPSSVTGKYLARECGEVIGLEAPGGFDAPVELEASGGANAPDAAKVPDVLETSDSTRKGL